MQCIITVKVNDNNCGIFCMQGLHKKGKGIGANHPTKYKQDAARCGRVEGLLRAPQAATVRHIYF